MTQNTFMPHDYAQYQEVDSTVNLPTPFNPDKVAELVNAQFTIPPVGYPGTSPNDTLIGVYLPLPVTQTDIDDALAKLNAICADPTINDLTAEQEAEADQAAELASIKDKIAADTANIALITTASPDTLAPNGYKAAFVATAYNALSDADKLRLLRMTMLAVLNILLDMLRSQRYILNTIKKDKTGSITGLKAQ